MSDEGEQGQLFYIEPLVPEPGPEEPPESAGRRLTRRNNEKLARGIHPATGLPLLPGTETCGTCEHAARYQWHNKSYIKCERHRLGQTHSAASDIRAGWPACIKYQPEEGQ